MDKKQVPICRCRICRSDESVVEFKNQYICEDCVTYVKENC